MREQRRPDERESLLEQRQDVGVGEAAPQEEQ
jgi:hypothetical protein